MNKHEMNDTLTFSLSEEKERITRDILKTVYAALVEKGYNPTGFQPRSDTARLCLTILGLVCPTGSCRLTHV